MRRVQRQDGESADIVSENIERLKELFPEAFNEGDVNFDVLRQLLGDAKVLDEGEEKYGLTWHGKKKARQIALTLSTGTLLPCPDESVDWDTTQNLFIEGDNLEVLKLLQKSYANKIKMIYIDPPYNTGKEFIYPDRFQDNLDTYLRYTGQVDEEGMKFSSNTESTGRKHTNWLNMMYPRLLLARHLLKAEGILLISIDDVEVHNLRVVCDDIFGTENFCGAFVWEKKKKPSFLDSNMGSVTDYIVAYAKTRTLAPPFVAGSVEMGKSYPFNNAGNRLGVLRFPPRTVTFSCGDQLVPAQDMSEGNIVTELLDDVHIKDGSNVNEFRLRGEWRYSQDKLEAFISANAEISISKVPFRPNYINRSGEMKKTSNLLSHRLNGVPTNEDATQEMRMIFGADVMSYPKPMGLIKYLVRAITIENEIILDFFAGSGTTAHAVMAQNLEDGMGRRFICVQLPEPTYEYKNGKKVPKSNNKTAFENGYETIAEIARDRIKKTAEMLTNGSSQAASQDMGYKAFKLDGSNIRVWNPDSNDLGDSLLSHQEHLVEGRSERDVLYELLLKRGIDLAVPVESRHVSSKTIYGMSGGGGRSLCLFG